MDYIQNSYLIDSSGNRLIDINNQYLLSRDSYFSSPLWDKYINNLKKGITMPIFKFTLLYDNENEREDITQYVIEDTAQLTVEWNNGVRRSLNFSMINQDKKWDFKPLSNGLNYGTKIKLKMGVVLGNDVYWCESGIFVLCDMQYNDYTSTVTLQFKDKFVLLEGTVGGKFGFNNYNYAGANVRNTIESWLNSSKPNQQPYDYKPLIFPIRHQDTNFAYDIKLSPDETIGDLFKKIAEMLSCDIYYNVDGNLVFEDGVDFTMVNTQPIIYNFSDEELDYYPETVGVYDFNNAINCVNVTGGNINGAVFMATAKNTNLKSPLNIYIMPDIKPLNINNENIFSQLMAQETADYNLYKQSMLNLKLQFNCTFIPHLDVNKNIAYTNHFFNINNDKFLISKLNITLSSNGRISGEMSNTTEVSANG